MRAVNLIPAEQRVHSGGLANRSEGVAHIVLGMLAGIALLALVYGSAKHDVTSKENEATRLEAQAQTTQQEASGLSQYKSFVSLREAREHAIVGLINSRFDWAHSLSELGRVLPPGSTVATLQGAVGATGNSGASSSSSKTASAAVTSATPPGTVPTLTISGCATGQSTVAQILTRLRLMDGVNNVELHSSVKSANGSASSTAAGGGSCSAGDPAYSAQVTFEPLPSGPTSVPTKPTTPAGKSAGQPVNASDTAKTEPTG